MATRVERTKKMKTSLNFYKNSFEMHPPYMVICDGNFIFAAQDKKIELQGQLTEAFKGKVYLKVPDCVTNELNSLKEREFDEARKFAREKCQKFHCSHPPKTPEKCILESLRHNFVGAVGTQDSKLRRLIHRDFPKIPVFYINNNGLQILKIPKTVRDQVEADLLERYGTKDMVSEMPASEPQTIKEQESTETNQSTEVVQAAEQTEIPEEPTEKVEEASTEKVEEITEKVEEGKRRRKHRKHREENIE